MTLNVENGQFQYLQAFKTEIHFSSPSFIHSENGFQVFVMMVKSSKW